MSGDKSLQERFEELDRASDYLYKESQLLPEDHPDQRDLETEMAEVEHDRNRIGSEIDNGEDPVP